MLGFFYGAGTTFIDVTAEVLAKCRHGDRIYIPSGDTADRLFRDPLPGVIKSIVVVRSAGDAMAVQLYGPGDRVWLSLPEELVQPGVTRRRIAVPPPGLDTAQIRDFFHDQLDFAGGNIKCEWVEQHNVIDYLDPRAKVLELGSGYGTNTMMISCILNDESNLVTLECNEERLESLHRNREANGFRFHIEPAALSRRTLMYDPQTMTTEPADALREGCEWINTVTFAEIKAKYGIDFDTLVADCEGALYYILEEEPRLLDGIRTVILEADFRVADHKRAVDAHFTRCGFRKVKMWNLPDGPPDIPQECLDSFWEVWQR